MAILVFTPFILTWFSKSKEGRNDFSPPKKIAEAVLLLLGLILFESFLAFAQFRHGPVAFANDDWRDQGHQTRHRQNRLHRKDIFAR